MHSKIGFLHKLYIVTTQNKELKIISKEIILAIDNAQLQTSSSVMHTRSKVWKIIFSD